MRFHWLTYDLGSGQFAVVKRLKHRKTGQTFAGKYIRKKKVKTSRKVSTL